MKKVLIIIPLCFAFELNAQTIKYDYHTGQYTSDLACAKKGSNVSYQIININRFAKKAEIESELSVLSTDIPAEIASVFRITTEADKKLDNTNDQITEMDGVQKDATDKVNKAVVQQSTKKQTLAVKKQIEAVQTEAKEVEELVEYCKDYYKEAEKIKDLLNFKKVLAETMGNGDYFDVATMRTALDVRGINYTTLNDWLNNYNTFISAYNTAYYQYAIAANAAVLAGDAVHETKIKNAQKQVQNDYDKLKEQYQELLKNVIDLFDKAVSPASYIFTAHKSVFIEDDTDQLTFLIRTANIGEDFPIEPFKKQIRIQGGVKIEYSVGLAFNSIVDHKFYLDSDNNLQKRVLKKLDQVTPNITSMIHIYKRTCENIAFGGMFGLNAGFKELTDVNLGFQGGGSAIIGHSKMFIVSAGLSYSLVDRLKSDEYNIGYTYADMDFKIENVGDRILRPSFFVAVSLAIPKRKAVK